MGMLVNGKWESGHGFVSRGAFVRKATQFRGVLGSTDFPVQSGRYHLYVSLACPWAHRTIIYRKLFGLESQLGMSVVDPVMLDDGWELDEGADPVEGARYLRDLYVKARPDYSGRVTVPVLWDKQRHVIVNNESGEIIRMFNAALAPPGMDFYPEPARAEIDATNAFVYENVNDGVYRCGFAGTQEAYEDAFGKLFAALDELELRLGRRRFLCGAYITEADWRLFTTLVRFDAVYVGLFKCNRRRIVDYPNLWGYLRELYQHPGVASTVSFDHIKRHYYVSHTRLNPGQIIPCGPDLDLTAPHLRGQE